MAGHEASLSITNSWSLLKLMSIESDGYLLGSCTVSRLKWFFFNPGKNPDTASPLSASKQTAAAAKLLQSCPTLCDPIDGSPPGSPVLGILQARTLEWVAISFSNALKWKVKGKLFSHVRLLATPWIAAYQAPPPMGFSRQEYWSGVPLPSPIIDTVLYLDNGIIITWWLWENINNSKMLLVQNRIWHCKVLQKEWGRTISRIFYFIHSKFSFTEILCIWQRRHTINKGSNFIKVISDFYICK